MGEDKKQQYSFWYRNSLSLVLVLCFILAFSGQTYTGWIEHNSDLEKLNAPPISLHEYLSTGHFAEVTFENWESEFLQMFMYVMLTIFLRQQGSSESKSLEEPEEVDREPLPHQDAPWPVKKGGWWLRLYKSSLTIAFIILFIVSFWLHAYGSLRDYNEEQRLRNEPEKTMREYILTSRLWFESFQNWQSEFVAVTAIVVLSIYLRQKGSPESKPVDAPILETGN
ncbi:MAG TPA: DUF6766 family protein [Ohtaekwangia sp.]|uniref:DUF6766 family protein n=1 Tax=Ohtaekwangia sp. TaxID=2066019 RepID=UPI002F958F6C